MGTKALKIAKAMVKRHREMLNDQNNGSEDCYMCIHCFGRSETSLFPNYSDDIKHEDNCIVLEAKQYVKDHT